MLINERRENSLLPMGLLGFTGRIKIQRHWPISSRFLFDTLYIRMRGDGPEFTGAAAPGEGRTGMSGRPGK